MVPSDRNFATHNTMEFFDWSTVSPRRSFGIDRLMKEYVLIAKAKDFYKENGSILEMYAADSVSYFPSQWHNYVSLVCEQDVFVLDQLCKAYWPTQSFAIVKFEDPSNEAWYHYTLKDEKGMIYDLQLYYMPERQEWLRKMKATTLYRTQKEKLALMDDHGFPWDDSPRELYL